MPPTFLSDRVLLEMVEQKYPTICQVIILLTFVGYFFGTSERELLFFGYKMYTLAYSRNGTIVGSIISFIITLLSKS